MTYVANKNVNIMCIFYLIDKHLYFLQQKTTHYICLNIFAAEKLLVLTEK